MSTIDLTLDNNNELTFQVNIEGSSPAKPSCRFLIEGEEMSFAFPGEMANDGIVHVNIPPLEKVLKEGNYNSGLEVIVDDRVFVPLTLTTSFEKSVKVTAEAVTRKKRPAATASAQLIGTTSRNNRVQSMTDNLIKETEERQLRANLIGTRVRKDKQKERSPIPTSQKSKNQNDVSFGDLSESQVRNLIRSFINKQ